MTTFEKYQNLAKYFELTHVYTILLGNNHDTTITNYVTNDYIITIIIKNNYVFLIKGDYTKILNYEFVKSRLEWLIAQ